MKRHYLLRWIKYLPVSEPGTQAAKTGYRVSEPGIISKQASFLFTYSFFSLFVLKNKASASFIWPKIQYLTEMDMCKIRYAAIEILSSAALHVSGSRKIKYDINQKVEFTYS
jgi:hypothetical protein